ncbi:conjugal transfer protein [Streptomyces sp. NBC_01408]|uniref:conjugal transfer protein n=1 Tax=Streptomyces sp. NBC_01408 TaxID=2903855 RepID=UPI0022581313|nr:conjugal transfer protein [Streptomyces sp. NBC_01408]MCX4690949.1 conjugal transfer protein [Streptomyces sp. NBC_01408]
MGLPEPVDRNKQGLTAGLSRQDEKPAPQSANPWEAAGAELAARDRASAEPGEPAGRPTPPAVPWVPQDENSGVVFARRLGRGLLWAVVALAAVTGVRAWVVPPKAPTAASAPAQAAPSYPTADAQAAAARFARAYLGWDEARKEERAALLASVLPVGADSAMGWDGKGRQEVLAVQPGAVTPGEAARALVRVDVLIRSSSSAGPSASPVPGSSADSPAGPAGGTTPRVEPGARWVGLDVPVVQASGRFTVTGRPGLVGMPAAGPKLPDTPAVQTDAELTGQTKGTVEKFFAAYAGGDTESVSAPGAQLPALPQGIEFKALVSWSVDTSGNADRSGTAQVSWALGGATVEVAYRVKLTRVSSSGAQRWQVADIRGGTL